MDRSGDLVDGDGRYVQGLAVKTQAVAAKPAIPAIPGPPPVAAVPAVPGVPIVFNTDVSKLNIPSTASSMSVGQDGTVYYVDLPEGGAKKIADAEKIFADAEKIFNALPAPTDAQKTAFEGEKEKLDKVMSENKATLQVAGQIQMAKFSNPGGLEKTGGNLFRESANSGEALTGFALQQGFGQMESGFLEMSNVDLAEEFTEMIVAQRGFQANTRIITTSDEILQELVNLKR